MLTSLNWLKDYVDLDLPIEELEDILTNSGTKVETVERVNENAKGIVAGRIKEIRPHPNADKLVVCAVDVGAGEPATVVTSATNVFEGALVPVAMAGSVLGDGTVMEAGDFRGVNSEGMFCSVAELGMNTDLFQKEVLEGIYILPEGFAEPGDDLISPLWIDDDVIDIELTANRGDCQSIYGIAREAAAAVGGSVRPIEDSVSEGEGAIGDYLKVSVESDYCPRYTARMFKVNKIEPSPMWMQLRLLNSGVRPINNIVDVTNYVMLEMGQPLHAFDYNSIGTDEIIVKTGNPERTVTTLDEKERPITEEMLMITNGRHPIAVAGVMGGLNSEITGDTELVVLESANFDKTSIRLTSKALGLRTESSSRYEKGIHPELAAEASARAAHLFEEIGAATPIAGVIDVIRKENPEKDVRIPVSVEWLNRFLGTGLSVNEIREYLNRLMLGTALVDEDTIEVSVPEYRLDLRIREDIAEEVARLYGYNNLPSTIMSGETFVGERDDRQKYRRELERLLVGLGLYQTMTTSFTGPSQMRALNLNPEEDEVRIINPLGEESSLMRSSLLPHQMEVIALNSNRGNGGGGFFEIQKTYHHNEDSHDLPGERLSLAISEYGPDADFFGLKGKVEEILKLSGIKNARFTPGGMGLWHPGRKAVVSADGVELGQMGEVHPKVMANLGVPGRAYAAEFDFERLFEASDSEVVFEDLPRYPDTGRDLAILVDEGVPAGEVAAAIAESAGELLESLELFDVYTGRQVPEGQKSLAYSLTFRHPERTLTDEEINPIIDAILNELKSSFGAVLRY